MTTEQLIEKQGGLAAMCQLLGWQGGTIHQVKAEMRRRFNRDGIVQDKQGDWITLSIGDA